MHILGISGSLRAGSFNTALLQAAQQLAPTDMTITIYDLAPLPFYNQDQDGTQKPDAVRDFKQKVGAADGLLIASPEYNYSVTGVLKNAIDWASRPDPGATTSVLTGKPVAILGASPGQFGTLRSQMHLRQILLYPDCFVVQKPEVYVNQVRDKFDRDGQLTDEPTRTILRQLLQALALQVGWVQARPR